ncbi:TPA: hypothetical protein L9408_004994 [Klebsiella pneumoniae]|nr:MULTISPECIES: hypothetical protein [Klebsiella]HCC2859536.1 hypothetical protein [Klebsiella variicola]HDG7809146.1 hypothetical protein [Klebsiella quasipneumoniae]EIX9232379.1 hypothetical protein [Klebsiella pneumoniae]EJI4919481.1 hypothetical protein [Klebsiella pneumoniae]EJW5315229.1 hypothetical protein [Klebsiella pneumoniae]
MTFIRNIMSYLLLLFSMWPVFMVLLIGVSLAFYGVLMRKTAIFCFIAGIIIGLAGWLYG